MVGQVIVLIPSISAISFLGLATGSPPWFDYLKIPKV